MTHEERRERRKGIANAITAGETVSAVALRFGVGVPTVYKALQEHGVPKPPKPPKPPRPLGYNTYLVIVALVTTTHSYRTIARSLGITFQRVGKIAQRAKEAGIPFAEARKGQG